MKNLKLGDYKRNRVDKLDSVVTGVNIERRQKSFIERHGVNLSALVRDLIDGLMKDESEEDKRSQYTFEHGKNKNEKT